MIIVALADTEEEAAELKRIAYYASIGQRIREIKHKEDKKDDEKK